MIVVIIAGESRQQKNQILVADFLTWTRLSVDGFTPTPCTKHCAVVIERHQPSRRSHHSMPTLRSRSSGEAYLPRASTGQGRRRHRQTVPQSRLISDSRQSVETVMTDLQTVVTDSDKKDGEKLDADNCCDACASTLRRNHRVSSQPSPPVDNHDIVFNSSREQLILELDRSATTTLSHIQTVKPSEPSNIFTLSCVNATCSCHHGTYNPTFVSDDAMSHCSDGYTVNTGEDSSDHIIAAQALMQPLDGQATAPDSRQTDSEAAVELACYSLRQNGSQLVIEDLELDSGVVLTAMTLLELGGIGRPDVREAWPDMNSASTDEDTTEVASPPQSPVCMLDFLCLSLLITQ